MIVLLSAELAECPNLFHSGNKQWTQTLWMLEHHKDRSQPVSMSSLTDYILLVSVKPTGRIPKHNVMFLNQGLFRQIKKAKTSKTSAVPHDPDDFSLARTLLSLCVEFDAGEDKVASS